MNDILINIITVVVTTVIIPLVSIGGSQLIKFINSKIKNTEIAKQFTTATNIVTSAVRSVFQTYVDALKKENKFTKEAQETAFKKAKELALSQLTADTRKYIETNYGDLEGWLTIQIEATIDLLKSNSKLRNSSEGSNT